LFRINQKDYTYLNAGKHQQSHFRGGNSHKVIKLVICGDGGIGKTTLLKVLSGESYSDQDLTVGLEIFIKRIRCKQEDEILQIWDLGGQVQFRFLLPNFFRGAHGVLLAFDVTRRTSFQNIEKWIHIIDKKCPQRPIILLGTKADSEYHPTLNRKLINKFTQSSLIRDYIEVSAKNNINIFTPFIRILEEIKGLTPGSNQIVFSHKVGTPSFIKGESTNSQLELTPIEKGYTTSNLMHDRQSLNDLSKFEISVLERHFKKERKESQKN